ncbi:MAG: TolC family protein [Planctomycetia bacterium]|nr:TolC family protein [Planctomycetia bacterium]
MREWSAKDRELRKCGIFLLILAMQPFFLGAMSESAFGESIEQAWDIALRESRRQESKRHETAAAQSGVAAAQGARLPRVTNATAYTALSTQPMYEIELGIPGLPLPTINTPLLDKDFVFSTTQAIVPVYTGGKISSLIDQACARAQAAELGERTDIQVLKMSVAENYLLVLRVQGIVEVLEQTMVAVQSHERTAADMFSQGLVTKNVLLQAQVARAEVEQKLIQARNALDIAKAAYNRYLWRPLEAEVSLNLVNIPPESGDLDRLTQIALQSRTELQQLSAQAQGLYAKARESRSERLPQVVAAGGYTYIQNEALVENDYWSATVGMVWTPIDGGVSRSKERAMEHQATAVNKMRDEVQSAITLEVRKNWLEEKESRNRVRVARQALDQSEENLRVVSEQFAQGLVPHTEKLDAIALYSQARTNYCNASYDAILATYRLRRSMGAL